MKKRRDSDILREILRFLNENAQVEISISVGSAKAKRKTAKRKPAQPKTIQPADEPPLRFADGELEHDTAASLALLLECGVDEPVAKRYAQEYTPQRIAEVRERMQLRAPPPRNPAGYMIRALDNDWVKPGSRRFKSGAG